MTSAVSGYHGGSAKSATYSQVSFGGTAHAEAVVGGRVGQTRREVGVVLHRRQADLVTQFIGDGGNGHRDVLDGLFPLVEVEHAEQVLRVGIAAVDAVTEDRHVGAQRQAVGVESTVAQVTAQHARDRARLRGLLAALRIPETPRFIIVTVPTPIDEFKRPDLRPVESASRAIGRHLAKGSIVVYESTVYPGATEEVCIPLLERESGLQWKKDFFVGYSPERINPGDREHTLTRIVKVVSGDTPETLDRVADGALGHVGIYAFRRERLDGRRPQDVRRLILTASGGPFRDRPREFAPLRSVRPLRYSTCPSTPPMVVPMEWSLVMPSSGLLEPSLKSPGLVSNACQKMMASGWNADAL